LDREQPVFVIRTILVVESVLVAVPRLVIRPIFVIKPLTIVMECGFIQGRSLSYCDVYHGRDILNSCNNFF
jgi:hypothetical protein